MKTRATYDYEHGQQDSAERFPAPLLYIGWDDHLMYCAPFCVPLPGEMLFGDMVRHVLPTLYGEHPDFAQINWSQVQWRRGEGFWAPRWDRSLAENGLGHKDLIRLRTPGMKGLSGSSS